MVGVAHMAVPVDPQDADGALIDGKLRQPQRFGTGGARGAFFTGGEQAMLQHTLLAALPEHDRQAGEQQQAQQQAEVLPQPRRLR